jgi:hypothetical protein
MAQKRWEKYRRQAVKKIVEEAKSIDPSVSVGADAFGLVAAKQFTALMDSDKPAMDQLEKLYKMMTGVNTEESRRENASAPGAISGSPEALLRLVEIIERDRRQAVDAARSTDGEATDTRSDGNA